MTEGFAEQKKCYDSCKPVEPVFLINGDSELQGKSFIDTIYAEHKVPFNYPERKGFLPGIPVQVSITHAQYTDSLARLNPYLYTIELKHGQFCWKVRKRYHHFLKLHTALLVSKTKNRQHLTKHTSDGEEKSRHESIPNRSTIFSSEKSHQEFSVFDVDEDGCIKAKFPKKPDVLLSRETSQIDDRKRQLENYLQSILRSETYRKNKDLLEFFEVSEYSFLRGSVKCKEGLVKKRTGDDTSKGFHQQLVRFLQYIVCQSCGFRWRNIWLVICETCILGVNPKTGEIRTVLLFDKEFQISSGNVSTGVKNSVLLLNRSRYFWVKTKTARKSKDWQEELEKVLTGGPAIAFTGENRHGSFAPVRDNQTGQWFVDGESHMSAVADAIELAKEEIFITDWWLSPEIHLKRGVGYNDSYRLDTLLRKKSAEGVKIFILLYKEFQLALSLNSLYTKRTLMSKGGKNIKVLRHPDRVSGDVNDFLWAHHEKIVVVDQCIAFVGGIDLCYGRWDTNKHPLTDVDVVDQSVGGNKPLAVQPPSNSTRSKPRFNNERGMHLAFVLKAAHEVTTAPIRALDYADNVNEDSDVNLTNESEDKRMRTRIRRVLRRAKSKLHHPKDSDSEVGTEESDCESNDGDQVDGDNIDDPDTEKRKSRRKTLRRAIQRMKSKKKSSSSLTTSPKSLNMSSDWNDSMPDASSTIGNGANDSIDRSLKALPSSNIWKGKDYVNFIVKDIARPDLPEADNVDRRTTPRMPWHDIAVMVTGEAARDVARHFIQRWNTVKTEKAKFYPKYPFLVPKCYSSVKDDNLEIETYFARTNYPNHKVNCQVLRSYLTWGSYLEAGESSIHSAMIEVIMSAEHYIYIENQFFITMVQTDGQDREVKNGIGNAIFQRILRAHKENSDFKVYIMLPLLPAFEGQIGSNSTGSALRVILHYNYASICRGESSLFRQLELNGINPMKYVTFCSLRTWDELLNTPVTELVYIHSKLMIVDDRIVICGSANINDRSLLGSRDSEVCLLMEDTEFTPAVFNGKKVESGRFAGSLRRHLMREHLGILGDANGNDIVEDPVSDSFYKDVWIKRAAINTKFFEDVFLSVPNDIVTNLEDCKKYEERTPPAEIDRFGAIKTLKKVKGNLVLLPLHFLESEDLLPSRFAMEGMVPSITWT